MLVLLVVGVAYVPELGISAMIDFSAIYIFSRVGGQIYVNVRNMFWKILFVDLLSSLALSYSLWAATATQVLRRSLHVQG